MKSRVLLLFALWGVFLTSNTANASFYGQQKDSSGTNLYRADSFKCPLVFGTFSDPKDCSHYYVCVGGHPFHKKCRKFMHFDTLRKTCLPAFIAICGKGDDNTNTTTTTTVTLTLTTKPKGGKFQCPGFRGTYPNPDDCSKYYTCSFFIPSEKTCPEKQLFDAIKMECKAEESVNCGDRQRPGLTTTPMPTETVPNTNTDTDISTDANTESTPVEINTEEATPTVPTETTAEDIVTTPTRPTVPTETTAEDIVTTPTRPTGPPEHDCTEDDLDCIIDETGDTSDWFICPEDVGAYPHPSSDKLFIFCMNWIPSAKKCGLNLVFSTELSTCIEVESSDESEEE